MSKMHYTGSNVIHSILALQLNSATGNIDIGEALHNKVRFGFDFTSIKASEWVSIVIFEGDIFFEVLT